MAAVAVKRSILVLAHIWRGGGGLGDDSQVSMFVIKLLLRGKYQQCGIFLYGTI